ncbi:hypothetical protein D1B17_06165 [Companilactobacillus zhachilii]|uniref:HTH domain-containing protein n=1 Tax=Companilactobacillus zhachilii TaxID=2304606 RepID=A0A386PUT8_9LACO|nr:hypothetical protein [Companilactobacillus zhachilii]AYE38237.1 hypothetical protein D1B17_06165 [Companilactobacillus zhachilii]
MKSNNRIMKTFVSLMRGERLKLSMLTRESNVSERTIKRDMSAINQALENTPYVLHHDTAAEEYFLSRVNTIPFNKVVIVRNLLLESNYFNDNETKEIIGELTNSIDISERKKLIELLKDNKSMH